MTPSGSTSDQQGPRAQRVTGTSSALFTLGAWGLLATALVLVGTSAAPAFARAMGLTEIHVVRREFQRTAPVGQAGVDAVHDFERDIGQSIERLERNGGDVEVEGNDLKVVFAKRDLQLRAAPASRSSTVTVKAGTPLIVVRKEGLWLYVLHQTADDKLESGWVELRDLELP